MAEGNKSGPATLPAKPQPGSLAPHLVIEPVVEDKETGAMLAHEAYSVPLRAAWELENHIAPLKEVQSFGDVQSWAAYISEYGDPAHALVTWNASGLRAVLDYHGKDRTPGRTQWIAAFPFKLAPDWRAWTGFASGKGVGQVTAIEFLEDHAETIVEPPAADMANLLRKLKANVKLTSQTKVGEDGSTSIEFTKDNSVSATATLPQVIKVAVQVLAGHMEERTGEKGLVRESVRYAALVRLRASATDSAGVTLRFSIPDAERILEDVYAGRVAEAAALLGDTYPILRSAD